MQDEQPVPQWFTIKQASEYLGVAEPTLYRWMKDGFITYRKIGDSTRFRKQDLDAVVQVHPSEKDVERVQEFCPVCHHTELVAGTVQSTGRVYFHPATTKFWAFTTSDIPTEARMCARCGAITLFGDTSKLESLKPQAKAEDAG
jgi:excisionase family DNA binding protein